MALGAGASGVSLPGRSCSDFVCMIIWFALKRLVKPWLARVWKRLGLQLGTRRKP